MRFFSFILLVLWSISGFATTVTLTFESLQPTNLGTTISFFNNPITESGYTLTTTGSFSAKLMNSGYPVPDYYTGSTALQTNGTVSLARTDGFAFTANSIGLSNSYYQELIRGPGFSYPDPSFKNEIVTFTGLKSNGSSVSQTFTLSTSLIAYSLINFDNIVSLNWSATTNNTTQFFRGYQFDNINLSTSSTPVSSVPVPAAVWLFGSGLVGFAGLRHRKQKA